MYRSITVVVFSMIPITGCGTGALTDPETGRQNDDSPPTAREVCQDFIDEFPEEAGTSSFEVARIAIERLYNSGVPKTIAMTTVVQNCDGACEADGCIPLCHDCSVLIVEETYGDNENGVLDDIDFEQKVAEACWYLSPDDVGQQEALVQAVLLAGYTLDQVLFDNRTGCDFNPDCVGCWDAIALKVYLGQ